METTHDMTPKQAQRDSLEELQEMVEEDLREIRRPFQQRQDNIRTKYQKQINELNTQCAFEVQVVEQQYLEAEDYYRATKAAYVSEGPGSFEWSRYRIRTLVRLGYGLHPRGDGTWAAVKPEEEEAFPKPHKTRPNPAKTLRKGAKTGKTGRNRVLLPSNA
jgi:hypothetical protein